MEVFRSVSRLIKPGVLEVRPAGQRWPAETFCVATEGHMKFMQYILEGEFRLFEVGLYEVIIDSQ